MQHTALNDCAANCAGLFSADQPPEQQLKSATAHHTVPNCVPTQSLIQLDGRITARSAQINHFAEKS